MVITCPACSARYRLNPDKIKGRGAKITCPKCSHVFVVFSDATTEPTAQAQDAAAVAESATPRKDADTTTGAFRAVGLKESEISGTTGKIRVVAPGDRKTRRAVRALSRDASPDQIGAPDTTAEEDDSYEPATASELDFRSVGITTWKVKVSIGLIYDFSDISTLKKYLADKKVTEDDLISHNAADWTRIGDIGDLDQHFIETWKAAKSELDAGGGPKKKKGAAASPDSTGGASTAAQTLGTGSYSPATSTGFGTGSHRTLGGGTGSHNTVPTTGSQRSSSAGRAAPTRPRKSKAPPPPDHSGRNRLLAVGGVGALALLGAWFMLGQQATTPPVVEPSISAATDSGKLSPDEDEAIRERVRKQIEAQRQRAIDEELASDEASTGSGEELTTQEKLAQNKLEVVAPGGDRQITKIARQPEGQFRQPQKQPTQPPRQRQPAPVVQDTPSSDAKATVKADADPGKMYLTTGLKKLASGNFGSARSMCEKAVEKSPSNAKAWECIGDAKKNLGDAAGAGAAYKRAQELGSKTAGQ